MSVRAFQIDRSEVTVAAYTKCFDAHACTDTNDTCTGCELPLHPSARDNRTGIRQRLPSHPVTCVNFVQAANYCAWMHKRLPTEEEWELAARGGEDDVEPREPCPRSGRVWDVGDDQALRPLTDDVFGSPCPSGSVPTDTSPFGALDMTGNVREWTTAVAPTPERERGAFAGSRTLSVWHVMRGDSFINIGPRDGVGELRRSSGPAGMPQRDVGFRCARSD